MADNEHKATPPEEYELTEVDGEYLAECPFCDHVTTPEATKEQARVRLAMHILEEGKNE